MTNSSNARPHRFIDYFAIVSAQLPKEQPNNTHADPTSALLTPHISDFYPSVEHADLAFPKALSLFCFPDGISVHWDPDKPATTHSFVMTDSGGKRLFGTCVVFDERASGELLQALGYSYQHKVNAWRPGASKNKQADGALRIGKAICILSHWPYLQIHRGILAELFHLSRTSSTVPLERYVASIIHDVPLPPQGRFEVTLAIGGSKWTLTRPPRNKLPLCDTPVRQVFQIFDAGTVLVILRAVLTERRLLFVSSQTSLLTPTIETLLTFCFPFEWLHIYVPVLPTSLIEYLFAPTPYIIGCSHVQLQQSKAPLTDVIVVDLDTSEVSFYADRPLPDLPQAMGHRLFNTLDDLTKHLFDRDRLELTSADHLFTNTREVSTFQQLTRNLRVAVDAGIKNLKKTHEFVVDDVRNAFLTFFVDLMLEYRQYLMYPTPENERGTLFNEDAFLDTFYESDRDFVRDLVRTQLFDSFVQKRVDPEFDLEMPVLAGITGAEIQFFDEHISLMQRDRYRVEGDTPLLDDWSSEITDTFTVAPIDLSKVHQKLFRYSTFPNVSARLRNYKPRTDAIPVELRTEAEQQAAAIEAYYKRVALMTPSPQKKPEPASPAQPPPLPPKPASKFGPSEPVNGPSDHYLSAVLERATEVQSQYDSQPVATRKDPTVTVPDRGPSTEASPARSRSRTRSSSGDRRGPSLAEQAHATYKKQESYHLDRSNSHGRGTRDYPRRRRHSSSYDSYSDDSDRDATLSDTGTYSDTESYESSSHDMHMPVMGHPPFSTRQTTSTLLQEFGYGNETRSDSAKRIQALVRGVIARHRVTGLIKRQRVRLLDRLVDLWQQLSVSLLYRSEFYILIMKSKVGFAALRLTRLELEGRERQLNAALGLPAENQSAITQSFIAAYPGLREAAKALSKERRLLLRKMRHAPASACPKVPEFVYIAFSIDHKSRARKKKLIESLWMPSETMSGSAHAMLVRALYNLPTQPVDWKFVEQYAQKHFFRRGAHHRSSSQLSSTSSSRRHRSDSGGSSKSSRGSRAKGGVRGEASPLSGKNGVT